MDSKKKVSTDNFEHPGAYDANGKPLSVDQIVNDDQNSSPALNRNISRPLELVSTQASPELVARHNESVELYPELDLSEHEYVIFRVKRHIIGIIIPLIASTFMICFIVATMLLAPEILEATKTNLDNTGIIYLIGCMVTLMLLIITYVQYWVYINNAFFLTNESIIQKTQISLFSSIVKSVGLDDVVDVGYRQIGIIENVLNIGTLRIGTEHDETLYEFRTVRDAKVQSSILKEAVECFKSGRPIDLNIQDKFTN